MTADQSRWRVRRGSDPQRAQAVTEELVAFNQRQSAAVRDRFRPENLKSRPVEAYAFDHNDVLIGGCTGRTEDVWQWLTIDTMWVQESHRRLGVGKALLAQVEQEARERGCRWSALNTFDFQAPAFYRAAGYVDYGKQDDYPPGHTNYFLRKTL